MQNIKKITASETFPVRQAVLRLGKPIESCHFDGDEQETTIHFGVFSNKDLAGIVSAYKKNNIAFIEKEQFQIRGMAVLENYRKDGFGKTLLMHCEQYCSTKGISLLWFNARIQAVGFYEKMGYQKKGDPFEINDIGPHILMFKNL